MWHPPRNTTLTPSYSPASFGPVLRRAALHCVRVRARASCSRRQSHACVGHSDSSSARPARASQRDAASDVAPVRAAPSRI